MLEKQTKILLYLSKQRKMRENFAQKSKRKIKKNFYLYNRTKNLFRKSKDKNNWVTNQRKKYETNFYNSSTTIMFFINERGYFEG